MDILDNIIYANCASALRSSVVVPPPPAGTTAFPPNTTIVGGNRITSELVNTYLPNVAPVVAPTAGLIGMPDNVGSTLDPVYMYDNADKFDFCSYVDSEVFEKSIIRHWHDINSQVNYDSDGVRQVNVALPTGENRYSSFEGSSTYHLIFAYLTENTRLLQIFERLIDKFLHDEEFGIPDNGAVFNWMHNTERLFFQDDMLRSVIRQNDSAIRRNAYWRMFGMDLAFGDINSPSGATMPYIKAKNSNLQFVPLFEKYLTEVWQAYTNARNTAGVNLADIDTLVSLARDLQEMLVARRGNMTNTYANLNLSREEFHSVLITSWFTFIISDDTPVVQFLNCQSSTIGERLMKIGQKVGIPAHRRSQDLFELTSAATRVLNLIEVGGTFDIQATMTNILQSLIPPVANPATQDVNLMNDLLKLINYWEKATGHRLKNPESNVRGTVSITQPQRTNGKLATTS